MLGLVRNFLRLNVDAMTVTYCALTKALLGGYVSPKQ